MVDLDLLGMDVMHKVSGCMLGPLNCLCTLIMCNNYGLGDMMGF